MFRAYTRTTAFINPDKLTTRKRNDKPRAWNGWFFVYTVFGLMEVWIENGRVNLNECKPTIFISKAG